MVCIRRLMIHCSEVEEVREGAMIHKHHLEHVMIRLALEMVHQEVEVEGFPVDKVV